MTHPNDSDSAAPQTEPRASTGQEAAPVSFWAVLRAGALVGWVGGILLGFAEAAFLIGGVCRYFRVDAAPLGLWAGEAGRVILTHALIWALLLLLVSIPYAGLIRWRARKRPPPSGEAFLAGSSAARCGAAPRWRPTCSFAGWRTAWESPACVALYCARPDWAWWSWLPRCCS